MMWLSPESTVRFGYKQARRTLAELDRLTTWARLHPEIRHRHLCMWFSHPGVTFERNDADGLPVRHTPMGLGGGSRDPVQQLAEFMRRHSTSAVEAGRVPPKSRTYNGVRYYLRKGFAPYAPPGSSNHEDGTLEGFAAAVDNVGWEDHWMDRSCERFGLKNFGGLVGPDVNGEEWHTQLVEYGNSKRSLTADYARGVRHIVWPLPDHLQPPTPDPTPDPPEEDDMLALYRLWQPKGYDNIFLQGPGGAIHLGVETFWSAVAAGVNPEVIVSDHPQELAGVLARSGLTVDDLIPSAP